MILHQRFLHLSKRDTGDWNTIAEDFSFFEQVISAKERPEKMNGGLVQVAASLADQSYGIYAQFKPADFDNKESIPESSQRIGRH